MINLSRLFAFLTRNGRKGRVNSSPEWGVLCAILVFAFQLAASGATLVHRCSFTSNANDPVGKANWTLQGSVAISEGKVVLNGTGHAVSYVSLPGGLASTIFTDNAVTNGVRCYCVVTDLSIHGEESGCSAETFATPTAASPTSLQFMPVPTCALQLSWWTDHTGRWLKAQTNLPSAGVGTNWANVSGSDAANILAVTSDLAAGSAFFACSVLE